jgi:hypothetical protein
MTHEPFDDAYLRIKRAGKHLSELNDSIESMRKGELAFPARVKPNPQGGFPTLRFGQMLDEMFRPAIGNVIQELRTALDYMIYDLAFLDSGQLQENTQFVIEDCEKVFRRKMKSRLKGLSDAHIAMVAALQPCNGCDWIKRLAGLSNPDKHKTLLNVSVSGSFDMKFEMTLGRADPQTGQRPVIHLGGEMKVQPNTSVHIAFPDGPPVIETLEKLMFQVTRVLDDFKTTLS